MKFRERIKIFSIPESVFGNSRKGFLRLLFGIDLESISIGLNKIRKF